MAAETKTPDIPYPYTDLRTLSDSHLETKLHIQGRVHKIQVTSKLCFLVIRYQDTLLQVISNKKVLKDKYTTLKDITLESIINIYGILRKSLVPVTLATYKNYEMDMYDYDIVSPATTLPFLLKDAADFGESERHTDVTNTTLRLDNRWLDLRTPDNIAIFKIKSAVMQYFREYLTRLNFIEINSPKIIAGSSEGGAEVFKLQYFDKAACLAQSPQLYKQMAINSDFDRVFEVGPIFRAEKAYTHRHLCEFTGLDLEMTLPPNTSLLETIWGLLVYIFESLAANHKKELQHFKFAPPVYTKQPTVILFKDAVALLREAGAEQKDFDDLSTANERLLGELVKKKHGVDLFILNEFPETVRPFYTKPIADSKYAYAFDVIFRNQEIISGSERVHDHKLLEERVRSRGINPDTLRDYLNSFSHGSRPHGGCGMGLERIVTFYLGLDNIRRGALCPRDPNRLTP
jgi:aspartyl-tRNA synthetase